MDSGELKVFCGTSNPGLGEMIAKAIGIHLGSVEVKQFSDGETSVLVNESVRGKDVFVLQSTSPPVNDKTMELVLLIDALKRASARKITAVVPYFGYSRQDRLVGRSPISARLVADIICASGTGAFTSVDLHSRAIEGFFNVPVDNLSAIQLFADHFMAKFGSKAASDCVVVSPDVGGVKRARNLSRLLGCSLAIIDKSRIKGDAGEATALNIIGEVEGQNAILIDDIIDTAGSISAAAGALVDNGATGVYAAATHAVLSDPAHLRIGESRIKELLVTDSVPLKKGAPANVKVLSLAPMLAQAISRQHANQSVGGLFRE